MESRKPINDIPLADIFKDAYVLQYKLFSQIELPKLYEAKFDHCSVAFQLNYLKNKFF